MRAGLLQQTSGFTQSRAVPPRLSHLLLNFVERQWLKTNGLDAQEVCVCADDTTCRRTSHVMAPGLVAGQYAGIADRRVSMCCAAGFARFTQVTYAHARHGSCGGV